MTRQGSTLNRRSLLSAAAALPLLAGLSGHAGQARAQASGDPLPSWNNTGPKAAILAFVEKVTRQGSPDFVPEGRRVAAFDNDGTLWIEQPMYTQLAFALDRVRQEAPSHPDWRTTQPFKAAL